ncbi:MAG: PAS domain-containing sensor histidine kinase [Thermoanaerobaculia bacterium]
MANPFRRGLGREASILLPVSLLIFAALAAMTLLSYRSAITNLITERQAWTLRQARTIAERAARSGTTDLAELARLVPAGCAIAVHDRRGGVRWSFGFPDSGSEGITLPSGLSFDSAVALGPSQELENRVVAFVPFSPASGGDVSGDSPGRWLLRLESPEAALGSVVRGLRVLTPVVFGLSATVALVAVLFFRALTRPLDLLLARARETEGLRDQPERDDVDLLLATFDRALAALRASDGDPSGSERRSAERQLAESVAQLGELSAGVAHELRNSLATIQGYAGLLERRQLSEAAREDLTELQREADSLGKVVDDFLAFARPGGKPIDRLDLGQLVARALDDPALGGASFVRRPAGNDSEPAVEVAGDERLLGRALRNLLRNAIEAQEAAGVDVPIEVSCGIVGAEAEIVLRDHGTGIAAEMTDRLFRPFSSNRPQGAGLGLALARRIVLLHGGTLRLENHPDGGACATIRLPRWQF